MGRLEVETADHVVLRYDLAGGGNRGFAAVLDFGVATVVAFGTAIALGAIPAGFGPRSAVFGVALLLIPTIIWAYFILLEWLWNGQTLGKRAYGLRVISGDGSPAGFIAVFVRNLIRVVDFLPVFYGLGLLLIVLTPKNQRLGDLAAGTYVVRAPRPRIDWFSLRTVTPLGEGRTAEMRRLPGEAQRLVREFVARESGLAPKDRARVAATIATRLRPYASEGDAALDDVELIHAIARAMRATAGR